MADLRQRIKNLFPSSVWHPLSEARYALLRATQWPAAMLHPLRRESIAHLAALKDKHKGERCFIIGNGPSLKETDVSPLKDEYTFGMNRIYLAFPEWGFRTSYLVSVNDLVIEQCARDLAELDMPKFFSWRTHRHFAPFTPSESNQTHFLFTTHSGPKFARDARGRLWEGATVTYVCLQLAFHMGFDEAILIGVDHSFTTQGAANKTVVSQGDDPNHFDPSYFGKGFRWQLPDLNASEQAYRMARRAYQDAGRQVVDATIGGKLQVFPKVAYSSLFDPESFNA
jgi:hypothetical protein